MSLYTCSSCSDTIPLQKPRLHCTICRSYDICANCYVLSLYTSTHTLEHTTTLSRQSGTIPVQEFPPPPPLPPRPSSTNTHQGQQFYRPQVGRTSVSQPQVKTSQVQNQSQNHDIQVRSSTVEPENTPQFSPPPNTQNSISALEGPPSEAQANGPEHVSPQQFQTSGTPDTGMFNRDAQNQMPQFIGSRRPQPYANHSNAITAQHKVGSSDISENAPESQLYEHDGSNKLQSLNEQNISRHGASPSLQISGRDAQQPTNLQPYVPTGSSSQTPQSEYYPQTAALPLATHSIQRSQGWRPIFEGCNASPIGLAFFNTIFDCLDTQKKGLLTPEQYSAFNDVQGYLPDEDVWKRANKPTTGYNGEDLADFEFRTILENFSIEHSLQLRKIKVNNDLGDMLNSVPNIPSSFKKLMLKHTALTPMSGGQMPMLTRKGFVDITTLELLGGPSLGWQRLNRMARHYQIWREWGDCPREMLPEEAPQEITDRIKRVAAFSQRQAADRLEAARVAATISQEGRDHALRLLDPPGTKYYYRY